jgi:surface protein
MTGTFYGCSSLVSADLSNYIIDITSLNDLFNKCSSLQNVTINVKSVQSVCRMFKDCFSLKYLDLSNFNSNNIQLKTEFFPNNIKDVTIIYNSSIFENIKNLIPNDGIEFIDVEGYNGAFEAKYIINDVSKKIKIINIPQDKINMSVFVNNTKIKDLKENETEIFFENIYNNKIKIKYSGKLTNLFSLFSNLINLEVINLNEMDTSEVRTMEKMFYGCTSLKSVTMNYIKTPNLENSNSMFENCEKLEKIYMKNFDTKNIVSSKSMFEDCKQLNKIYIDNYFDLTKCEDASDMFNGCNSLKEIYLKNNGEKSVPINIKSIFNENYALERIYLNKFDKKIIIDISSAFNNCRNLKSIDLSKFDTGQVTSIHSIFSNCYNLVSIDITQLNLSNTNSFSYAFRNCTSLQSLDLSNFNTNKAESMTGTFYGCSSLISADLSNYIIDITSLDDLFCGCTSLQNVTISVKRVQIVTGMFKECYSLKYLDLSNFNSKEIIFKTGFFPEEITNATVVYNSSIFENIKNFIPNEGIIFIDVNIDLY